MREEPTRADFRLRDTNPPFPPRPQILIQFCANAAFKSLMKFLTNFIFSSLAWKREQSVIIYFVLDLAEFKCNAPLATTYLVSLGHYVLVDEYWVVRTTTTTTTWSPWGAPSALKCWSTGHRLVNIWTISIKRSLYWWWWRSNLKNATAHLSRATIELYYELLAEF